MKLLLAALFLFSMTACQHKTQFGDCIGILDEKKPDLQYKVSIPNIALAVIFSEMIFPPIIVLSSETSCPVGKK